MGLIRLLLALCVVVHHTPGANLVLTDAGIAVQAFYVISGYYMAMVLCGKYHSLSLFYTNRLLRLYPAYWVVLIVSFLLFATNGANLFLTTTKAQWLTDPFATLALIFTNITLFGQEWIVWLDLDPKTGGFVPDLAHQFGDGRVPAWQYLMVPQAWTLSLELAFYAIAPFVVHRKIRVIVALAVFSLIVRSMINFVDIDYNLWVRRFFPSEMCLFLLGVLSYRISRLWPVIAKKRSLVTGYGVQGALAALIVCHFLLFGGSTLGRAVLVLTVGAALPFLTQQFGRNALDKFLGDLSYPTYLCHLAVIAAIKEFSPALSPVYWVVLTSVLCAAAIFWLIERPIDNWRQARVAAANAGAGAST